VLNLGDGVTTEVTDTGDPLTDLACKCLRRCLALQIHISKVAVLAEEAVVGAGVVEDGEVLKAVFGTVSASIFGVAGTCLCGADPAGDAVGR